MKEIVAYKGEKFTIEWYFDEKEKSDVLHYFNGLTEPLQIKTLALFKRFAEVGEIKDRTKFNFEGDALYAFKPFPHRFLCFFVKGKKVIITNAFLKKTDKLPKNEKERALKRREDYEKRIKKGTYYKDNV
ncbi:type II toxin-antitoxin system RelE/ParE family toxin [Leptospira sp. GIMC2001]|uniref:type II toxin-antitoxin system RelE/ParE family toxin n=1 Tax=Leptospira sp. GIMC2001 TaxID=1513297 RepID=UPI00234AD4DE|nr:type II toxin-antitoxin system RelE/ParE family toxin [Leptospira sp. GIMC2001]WCL50694.1 type II toxin-antitoxin system RelE/ParE family toxin [Leptospira sp. GIMC2001]WCL50786.1 type II toxin-antitoxin system RelE/ParE family toxin [Leptospira sp. GIMC2001]